MEPIADRYETLRRGALIASAGDEAATGLALLLRRGVWAWARFAAVPGPQHSERRAAPVGPSLPLAGRSDLARLLAGMALAHPLTQGSPA